VTDQDNGPKEILEPEVLPPQGVGEDPRRPSPGTAKRAQRAFGPILAGVFLDFMDLATLGPLGFLMGAGAGFWLGSVFDLPLSRRVLIALASGWYCMMPGTRLVPLATLLGAYIRFREGARR
jgi:hypothetical protein